MSGSKWPGDPRDVNPVFDTANEKRDTDYIEHEAGDEGMLEYDIDTLEVLPVPWPHGPIKLPDRFLQVDQPYVNTCSRPSEGNRGCPSWRGCPYRAYTGIGPFNLIIRRKKRTEAVPCYNYYYSKTNDGYRAATISYKTEGWDIDISKKTVTCITAKITVDESGNKKRSHINVEMPVPNLGPMYEDVNDNGESNKERTKIPRGSRNGGDRLLEDSQTGGRGRGTSRRQGSTRIERRVQTVKLDNAEPNPQETQEVRSDEDNRSTGERGGDLRPRRGKVSKAGLGTKSV